MPLRKLEKLVVELVVAQALDRRDAADEAKRARQHRRQVLGKLTGVTRGAASLEQVLGTSYVNLSRATTCATTATRTCSSAADLRVKQPTSEDSVAGTTGLIARPLCSAADSAGTAVEVAP